MEFRRINGLPPYVFATINDLKAASRRAGKDVIDLGFGNPVLPSPEVAVSKLAEAAHNPRNHRYSASRGIPKLRSAITDLYRRKFAVELDPETEVVTTIGAKEGFSHLMWVLVGPGDTALVPSPSYPIHIWGPLFAGGDVRQAPPNGPSVDVGGPAHPPRERSPVPAQAPHGRMRPLFQGSPGWVRPKARGHPRPRLRLRRHRVR